MKLFSILERLANAMESNSDNDVKDYVLSCRKAVELAKIVLLSQR